MAQHTIHIFQIKLKLFLNNYYIMRDNMEEYFKFTIFNIAYTIKDV